MFAFFAELIKNGMLAKPAAAPPNIIKPPVSTELQSSDSSKIIAPTTAIVVSPASKTQPVFF